MKAIKGMSLVMVMVASALSCSFADGAQVAVQFPEGVTHGFLLVRSVDGQPIGQGEATKVLKDGDLVESRLLFRFKDGSLHDERVAFSQQRVFTLIRYHLVQRGPLFPKQVEFLFDRGTSEYMVRSQEENEKEELLNGHIDLPKDVYNGMIVTILTNLPKGTNGTVNWLVPTPEPKVVPVHLRLIDEEKGRIGQWSKVMEHYKFEPEIGMLQKLLGKIMGKLPAYFRYDCWIMAEDVPSFVQFEGRLQVKAPVMRIELISPALASEDRRAMGDGANPVSYATPR